MPIILQYFLSAPQYVGGRMKPDVTAGFCPAENLRGSAACNFFKAITNPVKRCICAPFFLDVRLFKDENNKKADAAVCV